VERQIENMTSSSILQLLDNTTTSQSHLFNYFDDSVVGMDEKVQV
jgi:hypothetical protein